MTLFTIRYNPGLYSPVHPDWHYSYSTICLADGAIAGGCYFETAERARAVVTSAYKTPLLECDARRYKAARRYCAAKREAVAV